MEDGDLTLERGFVASLRWLVAEGDSRGVRRLAVELRALQDALTTLDETRAARDEYARRAAELDREIQAALAVLGPGTMGHGQNTLVQRLLRLREKLAEDTRMRDQVLKERDAWRAMCTLLTHTRASAQEQLDASMRAQRTVGAEVETLRERVLELTTLRDGAASEAEAARQELQGLRAQLVRWRGTVERVLLDLGQGTGEAPPRAD
jgi:chromosome segregation ATPase